jgi:hypothetical protein
MICAEDEIDRKSHDGIMVFDTDASKWERLPERPAAVYFQTRIRLLHRNWFTNRADAVSHLWYKRPIERVNGHEIISQKILTSKSLRLRMFTVVPRFFAG